MVSISSPNMFSLTKVICGHCFSCSSMFCFFPSLEGNTDVHFSALSEFLACLPLTTSEPCGYCSQSPALFITALLLQQRDEGVDQGEAE